MIGRKNNDWIDFLGMYKGFSVPIKQISEKYRQNKLEKE